MRGNVIGDVTDLVFVQGFGCSNEVTNLSGEDDFIEAADRVDVENAAPFFVFLIDVEKVRLVLERGQGVWRVPVRQVQNKSRGIVNQLELIENAGARGQGAMRQIGKVIAMMHDHIGWVAILQQLEFVDIPRRFKFVDGVIEGQPPACDRHVLSHQSPHMIP